MANSLNWQVKEKGTGFKSITHLCEPRILSAVSHLFEQSQRMRLTVLISWQAASAKNQLALSRSFYARLSRIQAN